LVEPVRRTGKTALYETLKREILTLERAPDEDIDEARLSEQYGISRTPVRDVLRQLAGEGYVDIRENRGARVIPMNHATMRDFFGVAPIIYEAVGRLAVQNFRADQLRDLRACQERFSAAHDRRDAEAMVVENNLFHNIVGSMSGSSFLLPSYSKLLIDHARIGHTFFRPTTDAMEVSLDESSDQHDAMIDALVEGDEDGMVRLIFDHWGLCRSNMEMFIAPKGLPSLALSRLSAEGPRRKPRGKTAA
jgi:DNA-binding GntR family transcriptional regulator